jgi:hypothetical protein
MFWEFMFIMKCRESVIIDVVIEVIMIMFGVSIIFVSQLRFMYSGSDNVENAKSDKIVV